MQEMRDIAGSCRQKDLAEVLKMASALLTDQEIATLVYAITESGPALSIQAIRCAAGPELKRPLARLRVFYADAPASAYFTAWAIGAASLADGNLDADAIRKAMDRLGITVTAGAPEQLAALMKSGGSIESFGKVVSKYFDQAANAVMDHLPEIAAIGGMALGGYLAGPAGAMRGGALGSMAASGIAGLRAILRSKPTVALPAAVPVPQLPAGK